MKRVNYCYCKELQGSTYCYIQANTQCFKLCCFPFLEVIFRIGKLVTEEIGIVIGTMHPVGLI